jgi:hypothetical protein
VAPSPPAPTPSAGPEPTPAVRADPPRAPAPDRTPGEQLEERARPIVTGLARAARGAGPPAARLEAALEILFGAYGEGDPELSDLILGGWMRAREDKHFRLALAWHREQLRLSIEDILAEGARAGAVRPRLDPGAVAAIMLGAAEGCLLQAATDGGAVSTAELVRNLLALTLSEA